MPWSRPTYRAQKETARRAGNCDGGNRRITGTFPHRVVSHLRSKVRGTSRTTHAVSLMGAGEWGGAPAGTSCLRGPNTPRRSGTKALQLLGKASGPVSRRTHGEPPASRGAVTSQGRAGVPVSRCFRFPKTLRGSWRKKGRGRPPSCFWGLLGSLASVFQRVACIVVCRRLSLWRWISDLSQLEGLGS